MSRRVNQIKFRQLYDQGLTDRQIAQELGFVVRTVCAHRCKLGLASHVLPKNRWLDADVDTLRRMAAEGKSSNQIAIALNCSRKRVVNKARSEKICLALTLTRYSADDDAEILRSMASGESVPVVAARLGRTVQAIYLRRSHLKEESDLAAAVALEAERAARLANDPVGCGLPVSPVPVMVRAPRGRSEPDRKCGLDRLAARCGADLVAELAAVQGKKTYSKLDAVARRRGLPFQRVQSLWHQVRAV